MGHITARYITLAACTKLPFTVAELVFQHMRIDEFFNCSEDSWFSGE